MGQTILWNYSIVMWLLYVLCIVLYITVRIYSNVYVTVNMCNQGIRVFPEIFSEYAYSLKWSGNTRIP